VGGEAVGYTLADLLSVDGVGGNAFFFDELLDLVEFVSRCLALFFVHTYDV